MSVRCATCGLHYDPSQAPLPTCGSEDGPAGPRGIGPEGRKFMQCVLSHERCSSLSSTGARCVQLAGHPGPHRVQDLGRLTSRLVKSPEPR